MTADRTIQDLKDHMMTNVETLPLQELARREWEAVQNELEEKRQQENEKERSRDERDLKHMLHSRLGIEAEPQGKHVTIDGVEFYLRRARVYDIEPIHDELVIVRPCQDCNTAVFSQDIWSLAGIWSALQEDARCRYGCPVDEDQVVYEPDLAQQPPDVQLAEAIRRVIREELRGNDG